MVPVNKKTKLVIRSSVPKMLPLDIMRAGPVMIIHENDGNIIEFPL